MAVTGVTRLVRGRNVLIPATIAALVVFVAFAGLHAFRANESSLHDSLTVNSTLSSQARVDGPVEEGFRWLGRHVRHNETVVNEPSVDGSLWMYPLNDVKPLIGWARLRLHHFGRGTPPVIGRTGTISCTTSPVGEERSVTDLARRYNARWIFLDERAYC